MTTHKIKKDNKPVRIAVIPSGSLVTMLSADAGATPTETVLDDENNTGDWVYWGDSNDWPEIVRKKIELSTTAYPLLFKAVSLIYGDGIVYFAKERNGESIDIKFEPVKEIDDFFLENDMDRFMIEQLMDYKFFGNCFQELIFNNLAAKIVNIYHKEAEFSRLSAQNENTYEIEKLGYSGTWGETEEKTIWLYQKRKNSFEEVQKLAKAKGKKLANHTFFPSPGRQYYAMPPHGGLYRDKGWLDFSNKIPEILNAMLDNQMTLKYHIEIPYDYWPCMYKDWGTYTQKQQEEKIDEKLQDMDDWLVGVDNTHKTFISHFATDPVTGKPLPGWKITPIADKLKKDEWIPGTQEADIQIARALQIDPSMAGIQPTGGKLGAGSGSDKRTGMINSIALTKAEQKVIFEPLYIIKKFNKWPDNIHFAFSHQVPTTLDENPTGSEKEI